MSRSEQNAVATFRRLSIGCLIAVYLLIIIGSGVRASGAGMGCPDWPTCFGALIPPVTESQLPINYREIYAHVGYANQPFNAIKTWTEFGNRLAGVTTGLLVVALFFYALLRMRSRPGLIVISGAIVMITGFQGWIGSIVVSSNLHPLMVSTHMVLALVIIAGLHALIEVTRTVTRSYMTIGARWLLFICALVLLMQIAAGLQVREQIDSAVFLVGYQLRDRWIEHLDQVFSWHMFTGMTLLILVLCTLYFIRTCHRLLSPLPQLWLTALCGSVATGLVMWQFAIPAFMQPLHLLFASLQFGTLFHIMLRVMRSQSPNAAGVSQ